VIRADRLIPAVLADVIRKSPLCAEKVEFAWGSAVGPAMKRMTSVRLDAEGVLHVTASDAHWAREVKRSRALLLARLEHMLGRGVVTRLQLKAS
jgi:predicted nucleic acid-binding Zn ribbon protein